MKLSLEFIQATVPEAVVYGKAIEEIAGLWRVDSRLVQAGDVFVALKGAKHDGHSFIADVLRAGAHVVMVAHARAVEMLSLWQPYAEQAALIVVADPAEALCAIAAAWRQQFSYPVVGITGSVGKTTTKELLGAVLEQAGKHVILSQGNQNTRIGLSLNILCMRADHECAIFEMGISRRGEMARLSALVKPTIAVITAIGHSHMEGLGALTDIAAEKRDIFAHSSPTTIGVINGDQPLISSVAYACPVIKFGLKTTNQVQARQVHVHAQGITCTLKLYGVRYSVSLATENSARVYNALAAAAVAYFLHIPAEHIIAGIQTDIAVPGRFRKCYGHKQSQLIVDDAYNASPESMKSALLAFERMETPGPKWAVLGDMLELGVNTPFWHRQLGRFLRKVPSLQHVIFVGEHVVWAKKTVPYGMSCEVVPTWHEALERMRVRSLQAPAYAVLVKGSRGVGLHNVVHELTGSHE